MPKPLIHGLSDTPWHVGYLKMDEKDTRRDKRRCIYYQSDDDIKNHCRFSHSTCVGSTHCKRYKEDPETYKARQQERRKLVKDAQMMTSPNNSVTIEYGDYVRLRDILTKDSFTVSIEKTGKNDKRAAIVPSLVGKHLNENVCFRSDTYQIVSIMKPEIESDCAFSLPTHVRINSASRKKHNNKTTTNVIKTKVPGAPTVTVRKEPTVDDTIKAWIVEDYARYCRIDLTELRTREVLVKRKKGEAKWLRFLYCPCCKRLFTHAVYKDPSINLKDFKIEITELTPLRIKRFQNELAKKKSEL